MASTTTPPARRVRAAVCPITMAARRLAVERGHLGITNNLLQKESSRSSAAVGTVLAKMASRGDLAVGKVVGHYTHWFANDELARRWEGSTTPVPKRQPTPHQRPLRQRDRPAPVILAPAPDRRDQPAITPAGLQVKRSNAPTHDPRYQCGPDERPNGAGFAAAGIGRDVVTGRTWEPRA